MTSTNIAILGTGYAVPETIRTNDAPVFDWLKHHHVDHADLFKGYKERRVLASEEHLCTLLVDACQEALRCAGLKSEDIGALVGYGSVSGYTTPNDLYQAHRHLGLRDATWCIPLQDNFTNFLSGLIWAQQAISTQLIKYALVVTGCNWTRHVSYHDEVSLSIGDGAGAVVLGPTTDQQRFRWVGAQTLTSSDLFGTMGVQPRPIPPDLRRPYTDGMMPEAFTRALFFMNGSSDHVFERWGEEQPPALVRRLLKAYQVSEDSYTLIAHQASTVLIEAWKTRLKLSDTHYLNTIQSFGNMTLASIPVTLAHLYNQIETDYLVLLGMGLGIHTTAVLLQKNWS